MINYTIDIDKKILEYKKQGFTYSEIAKKISKDFNINVGKRPIDNRIFKFNGGGSANLPKVTLETIDELSTYLYGEKVVESNDQSVPQTFEVQKNGITEDEAIKLTNDGGMKTVKSSFDRINDTCINQVIRRPLTNDERSSKQTLLTALGFNPAVTDLISFEESSWEMYSKKDGKIELSSIKYGVKYKTGFNYNNDDLHKLIHTIKSNPKDYKTFNIEISSKFNDYTLMIPVADLHYGMCATDSATSAKYNMEIAEKRFFKTLSESIKNTENKNLSGIILVLGNDFFNADTLSGTTVKGTPQDQESVGQKVIYERGFQMVVKGIQYLSDIAPVTVLSVLSNHDEFCSYVMMVGLKNFYQNKFTKFDVEIISGETPRTYISIGRSLLGFAHQAAPKDVYSIMAVEQNKAWATAQHKYFFLAHYHKEITIEDKFGLVVYRLPTISGKSKWSVGQGYVGTSETNMSFLFHHDDGIVATYYIHA